MQSIDHPHPPHPITMIPATRLRLRSFSRLLAAGFIFSLFASASSAYAEAKREPFQWHPERSTSGPVLVVVSCDDQRAYVYRNGIEIGRTWVSTGKPGHETPTGVFHILNKDKDHHSKTYNNASMPYSERLTWDGVALHAGSLPGYPSSHGCIHLPYQFSKDLFGITHKGTTVVVTKKGVTPREHSSVAEMEKLVTAADLQDVGESKETFLHGGNARDGHLALVVSSGSMSIEVLRGGKVIGRAPITLREGVTTLPHAAFLKLTPTKTRPTSGWVTIDLAPSDKKTTAGDILGSDVRMPKTFAYKLARMMEGGTLMVTTPDPVGKKARSGAGFVIGVSHPSKR